VQDVLADPPFSRLDMVSCRNLLIYLRPEAQAKVIALFHFALRAGGILFLGSSETAGDADGRFEAISKPERLYRRIGRSRPGEFTFLAGASDDTRLFERPRQSQVLSRPAALADLCQRLVVETYAPKAVLINSKHECLYFLGPADKYLRVAPGCPTHDLLAMTRGGVRTKLRSAIERAIQEKTRIVIPGGRINENGQSQSFSIAAQPVLSEGEELLLICFVDEPNPPPVRAVRPSKEGVPGASAELERELEATKKELQGAIRNLEI
jgi:two-component system CheB/CheR fusion protein